MFFFSNFLLTSSLSFVPTITNSCTIVSNYCRELTVTKIIDGDTFTTKDGKHRLLGVDTPETYDSKHNFQPTTGPQYFYGMKAKKETTKKLLNKKVELEEVKKDKYGRWVTRVTLEDGEDFSSYLVENGLAAVRFISPIKTNYFYYYDAEYIDNLYHLQDQAKLEKKGIWAENNETLKKIYPS